MPELLLQDYLDAVGDLVVSVRPGGAGSRVVSGASSDSREILPGWLFCAVRGSLRDGHGYVPQAVAAGAAAVLAEREVAVPEGVPLVLVRDGYRALALVAERLHACPARRLRCLGVTGTNGKTTCAFLLRDLLRAHRWSCGMLGTVEYDLGDGGRLPADRTTPTPFVLQRHLAAMVRNRVEHCILEVSSHALAQGRLANLRFDGAIFTNLTQDHLDYHGTMEAYFECKRSLFLRMMADDRAPVVVNADAPWGRRLLSGLPPQAVSAVRTGTEQTAPGPRGCVLIPRPGPVRPGEFVLRFPDGDWPLRTPLAGGYNLCNLALAVCLCRRLGMRYDEVAPVVAASTGAPGRLQPCPVPGGYRVYVDYAHTDDAIAKALQALRPACRNRLAIVFGCGGDRDRSKRPKMARAAAARADRLYITSDNPRSEDPQAIIEDILEGLPPDADFSVQPDRQTAIAQALREAEPGDVILIAGKGHEDYQEIQGVRHPFSDFEAVRKATAR